MTSEIQERDIEAFAEEELEYNAKLGIFARIPASTTGRRIGRCTKTPPGPSLDDAAEGDASEGANGAQDEIGSVLMERLGDLIKTPTGRARFLESLDGRSQDRRSHEDDLRLERTLDDFMSSPILAMPIRKVSSVNPIGPTQGDMLDVRADIRTENGLQVLWVSDDLIAEERLDEIIRCVTVEIEIIADENGVKVQEGGVSRLLRALYM